MARYVVMEPPENDGSPDRVRLTRDGFHFWAFLAPPIWLLWHRLWIEAALVFAAMLGLAVAGEAKGFGWSGSALSLLLSFYVGLEGAGLHLAALRRRQWHERSAFDADNRAEAEVRYAASSAIETPVTLALPGQAAGAPDALSMPGYGGRA